MISLERAAAVSSFDVEATVAVGRDRPEFLAVAQLAADLGRPIGARDVLRELLGPLPEVLGGRVIERSVNLGLLDRAGNEGEAVLSEAGRRALGHGEVLVPEEGIWRFFLVDDPLVPTTVVHVQRLESEPARRERQTARSARARGERPIQPAHPPELLRRCRGAGPQKSLQNGHLFQLVALAEHGAAGPRGELRLVLTWDAEASTHLSGSLPSDGDGPASKPIDADIDLPEAAGRWSHEALWKALVAHATRVPEAELERWRAVAGKLVVPSPFQALSEAARHSFRRDLDVPASDLPDLGRFERTALNDVDIVPFSEADAQDWLAWLQWEVINDHVTPRMLEQTGREQLARFPHHQPRPLGSSELLDRARAERSDRAWFLLGPSDLGLWS